MLGVIMPNIDKLCVSFLVFILNVVMLSVPFLLTCWWVLFMLSVTCFIVRLSVVTLGVVAPFFHFL